MEARVQDLQECRHLLDMVTDRGLMQPNVVERVAREAGCEQAVAREAVEAARKERGL